MVAAAPTPAIPFALDAGEVHLWLADLDPPTERLGELAAALSPDEWARAARFRRARDRDRWVAARGTMRFILARYAGGDPAALAFGRACACGDPRCAHADGKPILANDPTIGFSLSHSDGRALLAVARGRRVGADLECDRRTAELLPLARAICAPAELAALPAQEAPRARALLALWTRKEAYLKARGLGLLLPPQDVVFASLPDGAARLISVAGDGAEAARWAVRDVACGPGYVGALVVEGQIACVKRFIRGCRVSQ